MLKKTTLKAKIIIGFSISFALLAGLVSSLLVMSGIATRSDNPAYYHRLEIIVGVTFEVLIFVAMFGLAFWLSRYSRVNIENVTKAINAMALGDTSIKIEKLADDEFGHLVDEMNVLTESTKEFADIAEEVAKGNLTVEVKPRSEKDTLGVALQKMIESNHHALTNISEGAFQVMTSSAQVASASESLAQGSTEQASAIEQITASISEVADNTRKNAEEAGRAANMIAEVICDVQEENREMAQMLEAMGDINESSESISKIIKVIDDIAFQTNILALNAAVEAARAGDAGKGFAVVAEEVRNLAAKSAQAASETAELIEDSIVKVNAGSQIAQETHKSLEAVTNVVKESEALINSIAESSNYQATAVAQIDQAIGQISQVVQTNSATSEECAAASDELSGQAAKMRDLLAIYNLGN